MTKNFTERYAALFILAALLFNPPIMSIFNSDQLVFGVPLLFLYLFGAWSLIIGLNACIVRKISIERRLLEERDENNDA